MRERPNRDATEEREGGLIKSSAQLPNSTPYRYHWNVSDLITRCGVRACELSSTLDEMRSWFPIALCESISLK